MPRKRSLGVELLGDRCLLSGLPLSANPAAELRPFVADFALRSQVRVPAVAIDSATVLHRVVEVAELRVATAAGNNAVSIGVSNLPLEIVAALNSHFPGAELGPAELGDENGTLVYRVSATFDGHPFQATLTRDGDLKETERSLTSSELPQPVLDWFRQNNIPGAALSDAKRVTKADGVSYDVVIAIPGRQVLEATLLVPDAQAPRASLPATEEIDDRLEPVLTPTTAAAVGRSGLSAPADDAATAPLESETVGKSEANHPANQAPVGAFVQTPSPQRTLGEGYAEGADRQTGNSLAMVASSVGLRNGQASLLATALKTAAETVANVGPTAWLPHVAGAISERLLIDVVAVEQGLKQILNNIDALAEEVAGTTVVKSIASRVIIVVALFAGARLVILELRKTKRDPVLAFNAGNSSWSWVLGAATPERL